MIVDSFADRPFTELGTGRILLVPLGSCEQHGPHLPLNTDATVAQMVASDVAGRVDVDVAPVLSFGASGEHQGFAGLLSIGTEVLTSVLVELARSARATWSAVVFVSGHGGNLDALRRAQEISKAEGDRVAYWLPSDPEGDAHAGATETSVMMTIDPSVRGDGVDGSDVRGDDPRLRTLGVIGVAPSGVLGRPEHATPEYGAACRERWCAEVVEIVQRLGVSL